MEKGYIELYIRHYLASHYPNGPDWMTINGDIMLTIPNLGLMARDLITLLYSIEEEFGFHYTAQDFTDYGLSTINLISEKAWLLTNNTNGKRQT